MRKNGTLPWLRPDGKAQVTIAYEDGQPVAVDTIVISTQHNPEIAHADIYAAMMEHVIRPVIPAEMLTADTRYLINPTGRFVIGGPAGDSGLTGRKIIVDTYGGYAPALSPAKTRRRLTALLPMRRATLRRTSSRRGWRSAAKFSWRMPLASRAR